MQNHQQIKLLNHCFHKSSKKKKYLIDFEISDMKVSEQFDCSCKSILDISSGERKLDPPMNYDSSSVWST